MFHICRIIADKSPQHPVALIPFMASLWMRWCASLRLKTRIRSLYSMTWIAFVLSNKNNNEKMNNNNVILTAVSSSNNNNNGCVLITLRKCLATFFVSKQRDSVSAEQVLLCWHSVWRAGTREEAVHVDAKISSCCV